MQKMKHEFCKQVCNHRLCLEQTIVTKERFAFVQLFRLSRIWIIAVRTAISNKQDFTLRSRRLFFGLGTNFQTADNIREKG